jgi:hypothetical protein
MESSARVDLTQQRAHGTSTCAGCAASNTAFALLSWSRSAARSARFPSDPLLLPGLQEVHLLGVALPIWLVVVPPFPLFFAIGCSSAAAPTASRSLQELVEE